MHDVALSGCDAMTCGCAAPGRWQCPECAAARTGFLACSGRCLEAHHGRSHGGRTVPPASASLAALREGNRAHAHNWSLYEGHRQRLTGLLCAVQRGDGLCVLGAGNCDDLDLARLVREFGEVHLVDLDTDALERGVARVSASVRRRIVLHAGVDLTGLLGSVQTWAEHFPDERGFHTLEQEAVATIAAHFGRTFDVVASACVVSQLCVPFFRLLAARMPEWSTLMHAVARVHAGTMAALVRPGGTGVLVGDIPYRLGATAAAGESAPAWDSLDAEVLARLREGVLLLRRPDYLVQLVSSTATLEAPRLTEPWLWAHEDAVMLAYGVLFRRGAGAQAVQA
jgi:hypothetical protein